MDHFSGGGSNRASEQARSAVVDSYCISGGLPSNQRLNGHIEWPLPSRADFRWRSPEGPQWVDSTGSVHGRANGPNRRNLPTRMRPSEARQTAPSRLFVCRGEGSGRGGLSARAVEGHKRLPGPRTRGPSKIARLTGRGSIISTAITRPTSRYQRVRPGAGKFLEAARALGCKTQQNQPVRTHYIGGRQLLYRVISQVLREEKCPYYAATWGFVRLGCQNSWPRLWGRRLASTVFDRWTKVLPPTRTRTTTKRANAVISMAAIGRPLGTPKTGLRCRRPKRERLPLNSHCRRERIRSASSVGKGSFAIGGAGGLSRSRRGCALINV